MLGMCIDENKTNGLQNFIEALSQFCRDKRLVFVVENSIIDWHINDESELVKTILKQNKIAIPKNILNQIIEKAFDNFDLTDTSCYLANNSKEIEQLINLDSLYQFLAFTLEGDEITNVFFYAEGDNDMMIIIFYEESSNIKQFLISKKIHFIS